MTRLPPTLLTIWVPTVGPGLDERHDLLGGGDDIDGVVIQTVLCEVTSPIWHKGFDSF